MTPRSPAGSDAVRASPRRFVPVFDRALEVAYGENPHQQATLLRAARAPARTCSARVEQLHGKPLSFNNVNDLSAARLLMTELDGPACVIVKHANPCGVGSPRRSKRRTRRRSPPTPSPPTAVSSCSTGPSAPRWASALAEQFVEVLFAPGYDAVAMEALAQKPDVRDPQRSGAPRLPAVRVGSQACHGRAARAAARPRARSARRDGGGLRRARDGGVGRPPASPGRSSSTRSRTRS